MALHVLIAGSEELASSCPDFSFVKGSPGGDLTASIAISFARGMNLPRADSRFEIEDDDRGPIWTGYTGPLDPPELSGCAGSVTVGALGWWQSISYKRREAETVYGPRWDATVIGTTVEDAVINAISQGAPGVTLIDANVVRTGVTLGETENFVGQGAVDIVSAMMAHTQNLATPAIAHVRQGVFYWKAMDLAPRYQVLMANGAKVTPRYDPSREFTRVMVLWGKGDGLGQIALWPESVAYDKRGQIVDLVINAGANIREFGPAMDLARGIYARMRMLSPEWSLDISIPSTCPVQENIAGAWTEIPPVAVEPGYFIRIPDLDVGALGPNLEVPQGGFMTRVSWQNKTAALSISIGEPRGPGSFSRLARRVVSTGVPPLNIWGYLGRDFSTPNRQTSQTKLMGPKLVDAVAANKPPPVDYQIPAVSTQQKTLLPEVTPPVPPSVPYQINECDLVGIKGVTMVPPQKLLTYSVIASKPCTVVVRVTRLSNGALVKEITTAGGHTTPDGLYAKVDQVVNPPVVIEKADHLVWNVTTPDVVNMTPVDGVQNPWVTIGFGSVRFYPGYPGDQAPITGGHGV